MKTSIISLIFAVFFFAYAQALNCNNGNPCGLNNFFKQQNGYQCIQMGNTAMCTCPNTRYTTDKLCRLCDQTDICDASRPNFITCLEPANDYGEAFACLCLGTDGKPFATTSATCDPTFPLTSTTTAASGSGSLTCFNGGVPAYGVCNCPSGFRGTRCEIKLESALCEKVTCKNNGICSIQSVNGPSEAVCLCPFATWGEYCELNGASGSCSASSCMNGGACRENVVGISRHAYCYCPAGYRGAKCEKQYFSCSSAGKFMDDEMHEQGKYFECDKSLRAEQKSCPKGLRFNTAVKVCTYFISKK